MWVQQRETLCNNCQKPSNITDCWHPKQQEPAENNCLLLASPQSPPRDQTTPPLSMTASGRVGGPSCPSCPGTPLPWSTTPNARRLLTGDDSFSEQHVNVQRSRSTFKVVSRKLCRHLLLWRKKLIFYNTARFNLRCRHLLINEKKLTYPPRCHMKFVTTVINLMDFYKVTTSR